MQRHSGTSSLRPVDEAEMTDQVSAQTAANSDLGCLHEARPANGAAASTSGLWQSFEIDTLRRHWHAAGGPQKTAVVRRAGIHGHGPGGKRGAAMPTAHSRY